MTDHTTEPEGLREGAGGEVELQRLRLENADLRAERDRYRASAARYQAELGLSLAEINALRGVREDSEQLRDAVISLAREADARGAREREAMAVEKDALQAALQAEHDERLWREIVSLMRECERKFVRPASSDGED